MYMMEGFHAYKRQGFYVCMMEGLHVCMMEGFHAHKREARGRRYHPLNQNGLDQALSGGIIQLIRMD